MTIDPGSYEPAYRQLARILREAIDTGELEPGQSLPSESSMVQQHGVSRETARKAVALLRGEGVVVTEHARGSYVRDVPEMTVVRVGPDAAVRSRMPSVEERRRLGIGEGVPVFVVAVDGSAEVYPADRTELRFEGA